MQSQAQSVPTGKKPVATKTYSLEEYFDFEFSAEGKHEYLNGQIRAMAYTSPAHGEIQTNLMDALAACLKAKACKRYAADRMVYVAIYYGAAKRPKYPQLPPKVNTRVGLFIRR